MPGRILVVDDVATNRIVLKAKLAIACYDVLQAADGESALALARTELPDLILLDLAMPGMQGCEVLTALKADRRTARIPVVVVTSQADRRSRIAALRAGAEDYLTKPVDDMVLAARVRSLLRMRLMADELALREGTRRALGFCEDQIAFHPASDPTKAPARTAGADQASRNSATVGAAGRVALISMEDQGSDLADALGKRLALPVEQIDRADALNMARMPTAERQTGPLFERSGADPAPSEMPEVFVLALAKNAPHEGLMLLSELRASPGTAHAAVVVAQPDKGGPQTAMAFDLGASDVVSSPLDPEETALRITLQLKRVKAAAALRKELHNGVQLAVTDPLTGIPNRRYGLSHLERAFERALDRGEGMATLMLDLDDFKSVNDRHGHAAGDAVLRAVATRLKSQLRPVDFLARIGGEEFLVVLQNTSGGDALETAERLRRAVDAIPIAVPLPSGLPAVAPAGIARPERGVRLHQTLSIGLATGPLQSDTSFSDDHGSAAAARAFLARADAALLSAKAGGRNRVIQSARGGGDFAAA